MKVISRVSVGLGSYFAKFGPCKMAELGLDLCLQSDGSDRFWQIVVGHRGENERSLFNSPTKGRDYTVDPRQCKLQSGKSDLSTGQIKWNTEFTLSLCSKGQLIMIDTIRTVGMAGLVVKSARGTTNSPPTAEAGRGIGAVCLGGFSSETGTVEKTKEAFSTHQPKGEITLLIQGNASCSLETLIYPLAKSLSRESSSARLFSHTCKCAPGNGTKAWESSASCN
ncbi:hypothetical protein V6N11_003389 [Hibiscus sabdariffa]|uniref:Uncharacterized protein n=1 Tax=Hibiscus sabdariffa TaxID=183260 RepID=A0ABR2SD58_9ROSI